MNGSSARMMEGYVSFSDLAAHEAEGRDYRILCVRRESPVLITAPHAGAIERGVGRLATAVAGDVFSLYIFEGIGNRQRLDLHIKSHLFDEPVALVAACAADVVISIHGERHVQHQYVMIGGRDAETAASIGRSLQSAGFSLKTPSSRLSGVHKNNICNRGRTGAGVQLEISFGLRLLLINFDAAMEKFAGAVREGIG